jgi:hypothetical protein
MPASHMPMPLVGDTSVAPSDRGLILPLRRESPNEGSSESGRGTVVLLALVQAAFFSFEMAVMHDRSKRIAWSRDGSLSLAIWLT